jgi:TRAP-type C4-dicarboxylate transport system substrate-binding protein
MMDRLKLSLIFTVAMIAVLFFSIPVFAVRIKIATKAPENFKSAKIVKKMMREIEGKTDGKVRFKIYYGGVKGTGRDLLLKMKSGEIQGGEFTAGEVAAMSDDFKLMGVIFAFNNYEEVDYVLKKMTAQLSEQMEKRGYVVLGWIEVGFTYIMSVEPIGTVADLKGKKVWIPQGDRASQAFFEALGVSPIPMTIADVMLALQTGQIDTVANSFVGAITFQWHTKIKYISDIPLSYAHGLLMITKEAYDKIPAGHKDTVHKIVDRYFTEMKMDMRMNNIDSAKTLVKQGIQFVPVTHEQNKELKQIIEEVKEQLTGTEFPREGLIKMQQYLNEHRGIPSEGK